ncbi:MAG TPA: O-methyltransferase [Thermoanaerobaculaceae bacterium]|nr:O-methyltransferase [Thermoanaerobaculaceae bacterium]
MPGDIKWVQVQRHISALVPERDGEMRAMEVHAEQTSFPIVGPAAGQFCYQIARMVGARRVFELGSGFGYSTAWFARAVRENGGGEVHHVVWDEDLSARARAYLGRLGFNGIVRFHVSEAVEALARAEGMFDLIFNDIEKQEYPDSLPVIAGKLQPGGVLIVDNALWHGRVFDRADRSKATCGVRDLTKRLAGDPGWITSLVPIRDGLLVAMKA